jgi:hypothetical protein
MGFAFPWPMSDGEWLAWSSAAATILFGIVCLFAPRIALGLLRLVPDERHPEAVGAARSTIAGMHLGLGLSAILLAQPLLYLALGFAWGFAAFGRIISMLSDRGNTLYNWAWLVVELVLAALPLAFALGFVP